ncbi:hypothetical protein [Erythrobacter aureus]|uniref:Uncharacterized protein n=1 Tax=Erythrobacter aureus TaxID=2182384 RepID=A0A345YJE5_9SPHN|nr:hypothetical protein [Erythrobacter aureus]AXK44047.1 hypothetical protein DVR09_16470 [Erythrobacter aureus]
MNSRQSSMKPAVDQAIQDQLNGQSATWAGTQVWGGSYTEDWNYDWNDTAARNEAIKPPADQCVTDGQEFYSYYGIMSNTGGSRGGFAEGAWGKCVCD